MKRDIHTYNGHRDPMIESAQWANSMKKICNSESSNDYYPGSYHLVVTEYQIFFVEDHNLVLCSVFSLAIRMVMQSFCLYLQVLYFLYNQIHAMHEAMEQACNLTTWFV